MKAVEKRLIECGLEMHALKSKLVYCKDSNRKYHKNYPAITFDFLGFTFKPRLALNSNRGEWFTNFLPAVSIKAMRSMNDQMRSWKELKMTTIGCSFIGKSLGNHNGNKFKKDLQQLGYGMWSCV